MIFDVRYFKELLKDEAAHTGSVCIDRLVRSLDGGLQSIKTLIILLLRNMSDNAKYSEKSRQQ